MPDFLRFYGLQLLQWLAVVGTAAAIFTTLGTLVSFIQNGTNAPRLLGGTFVRGFKDLFFLSFRRISAIARLTFMEAYRRKAFAVGVVFLGMIMFSGWFVGDSRNDSIAPYISTVVTPMWMMLVPMSLLVACWGIPADVKERSIHTVVTKPARRSEIVIGRIFGYGSVLTVLLVVVAVTNYFWLMGQIPERLRDQLVARVPVYGGLTFLDRQGLQTAKGINVGDPWEYRSYIEGQTESRAIWTFYQLDVESLKKMPSLPLEQRFEAFRTIKGDVAAQTRFRITLVNNATKLRVPIQQMFPVREFAEGGRDRVVEIPHKINYRDSYKANSEEKVADLFADLVDTSDAEAGATLTVEIACVEPQQFIGVNPADLFVRMPDRSFAMNYVKAMSGIWLLVMLLVIMGTTFSTFVKGPVATILCCGLIVLGYQLSGHLAYQQQLAGANSAVQGQAGPLEALYQLVTKATDLPDNLGTKAVRGTDNAAISTLYVTNMVVPDLTTFTTEAKDQTMHLGLDISRGFDIPWSFMLYRLILVLSYFIPLVILGYFALQLRELEHK